MLARALAKPSNLLVLDEPTNDLDLETLDVLEEMLADLRRHRHPDQPRPRFPRPHRQRGAGAGGRGPLGRVRRRLHRHAGAARRRPRRHQSGAEPQAAARPRGQRQPRARRQDSKRRLSFNEKHALETLPAQIATLQADAAPAAGSLGDPGLYARDRQAFTQASEALSATQVELAAAEERWLELEMLREEIEGG